MHHHDEDRPASPPIANGAAFTSVEQRDGIPLDYVGEKLSSAIEELHVFAHSRPDAADDLQRAMYYMLVAHLALHNMLGKADDRGITKRLLNGSLDDLKTWLDVIARGGDVRGLAGVNTGEMY